VAPSAFFLDPTSVRNMPSQDDSERINRAIDAGRPLSEVALLFPRRLDALSYYAKYMASTFEHPLSTNCVRCGQMVATHEETYTWEAIVNTRATILWSFLASTIAIFFHHLVSWSYRVQFATRHCFCEPCARATVRKRLWSFTLQLLFFIFLVLALLAGVPLTVFLLVTLWAAPELVSGFISLWLLALVPLILSVAGFAWCRHLVIPSALKHVGRFPFGLRRVERIV
jgi:hypothetical protein